MSASRIVLTGSTGGLGSSVLKHIQSLIDPSRLIISLYNPSKAPNVPEGVEVRKGDYSDASSLEDAFKGAQILLLVSYPSIAHELRVKNHINAIDAAKRAGITHIFYTSLAFAGPPTSSESVAAVMRAHIDTEAYLKDSGLNFTIIREGIYSESYPLYLGFFDPTSSSTEVTIPDDGDGGIAWASRDELGEATAKLIVQAADDTSFQYRNKTVLLTGPEAVPLNAVASILSRLLDRNITVKHVEVDEYATSSKALSKLGPEFAKLWATTYIALKQGECAVVDPLLGLVLGRRPKEMHAVLEQLILDTRSAQGSIDQYAK
ncbi:NAD(P)-binding protein [Schizopora paradoxa]|uniref:NAD(P)-binding protein n=1 Tax=Schizopora paradoxa TaxID=27342 RepID=A0A0H2SED8_9AGAM|nr:NAD(P)-binding protein [Schizopora paradoxa]